MISVVWTHGDFHPYNVCAGGVIDLDAPFGGTRVVSIFDDALRRA